MSETIGERMTYYRKQKGLSLQDVADRCGVTRQYIDQYEKNTFRKNPSLPVIERIAYAIGVNPGRLLGWEDIAETDAKDEEKASDELKKVYDGVRGALEYAAQVEKVDASKMSFGERVKFFRERAGFTRNKLSVLSKVSPGLIAKYEKGDIGMVSFSHIERIAGALNVSPAVLMGWENVTDGAKLNGVCGKLNEILSGEKNGQQ
ncbi:MAG: helix-turn-helix domain-containing protein [Clostridia bacterium]|nr:helix-turn-helix domain-containing protein [Clostridia bacterium]